MTKTPSPDCYTCRREAGFDALPPRERIAFDAWWRVAHAIETTVPGWLVLVPRRHVGTIAELTDEEATTLGGWQVRLSRALHTVTDCAKTYVVQFAEKPGFEHVHFHVIPRPPDLAPELRGPGVFAPTRDADHVPPVDMDRVALALRECLRGSDEGPDEQRR